MALPTPYPPVQIAYTDWDTVIAAIEARLGTGAVGDLLMADTTVIKTGVAASDYFTIAAVDNDTSSVVELARATGAAEPSLGISRSGTITPAVADTYNLGSATLEYTNVYVGTGRLYFYTDQAESVRSGGSSLIWTVGSTDQMTLGTSGLAPATAGLIDLGTTSLEWRSLYVGTGRIYLYTDQAESIRSTGTTMVFGVGSADEAILSTTAFSPAVANGSALGTTALEWSDLFLADGGIIYLGADQDVTLTHVADQGITLNKAINFTPDAITATNSGVAASITTVTTEVTTNGDSDLDNVTLANGTEGQMKIIKCVVEGNWLDTWKITPATMCGGTQITFAGVGEGCVLVYDATTGWCVVGNHGGVVT